ncbi:DUF3307 domain-containing protein [Bacillus pinisoli]|uniref:DUF3307 domain-containing protein n=1 Tax=Bacillus pinisoli TaxID=2901866 RepID=UPI001FF60E42|nr:DUF3307 domain-containing protein [Bacillus pinisoli]
MSQFDFLLIGHLIGDFLFQTSWMAQYKATRWIPLLSHVTVYTIIVAIFGFLSGGISIWGIVIIFIGHIILDRKTFVTYWVENIQRAKGPGLGWLSIVTDQIFHLILLVIAIYV